jgi:hypothetical protein
LLNLCLIFFIINLYSYIQRRYISDYNLKKYCFNLIFKPTCPHSLPRNRRFEETKSFIFQVHNPTEKNDILNDKWDSSNTYDNSSIGIYIPNITTDQLAYLENERNPWSFEQILDIVSFKIPVSIEDTNLIYSTFAILHEFGHWFHFINSKMSTYQFYQLESKQRDSLNPLHQELLSLSDYSYEKHRLAKEYNSLYRKLPSEKIADDFALQYIEESIDIIKRYSS